MVHAKTVINPSASTGPRPHRYVIDTTFGLPASLAIKHSRSVQIQKCKSLACLSILSRKEFVDVRLSCYSFACIFPDIGTDPCGYATERIAERLDHQSDVRFGGH
jgi:hypothetical protein